MPRKSSVKTGDVVYIKKAEEAESSSPQPPPPAPTLESIPEPTPEPVATIAPTTLQKQKVKELSEAKKAHMARLAEMNREKREKAKQAKIPPVEVPEPPQDAVRMAVRPKRQYKKKDRDFWEHITDKEEKRKELEGLPSKNEVIHPVVELEKPKPRQKKAPTPPPKVSPKPVKSREVDMPRSLPLKRQSKYYREPISESEEEESDESESDDEEEVERVVRKTHKRISTLNKIDERLKALQNPYALRGLSVF
jgi:hypothetical protein